MKALLFPGQGSQLVGMGSELHENFKLVKDIFSIADEKLNYPISKIILNGPAEVLQLTKNTQPAIMIVSYAIFSVIKKEFGFDFKEFKFFAGHSLGEYSALVCSDSLKFEDALFLLHERGKAMQEAVPEGKGSMLAILGQSLDEVKRILKEREDKDKICEIANDNTEGQIIISGDKECIEKTQLYLKNKKIKTIPLKVSAPFHCSLMKSAAKNMQDKILKTSFAKPRFNVVSNVTSEVENDPEKIKKLLVEQIYSTVRWRESILKMIDEKIDNFVEVGPGKALTGMIKRMPQNKNVNCFSVNTINDIKNLSNEFKK